MKLEHLLTLYRGCPEKGAMNFQLSVKKRKKIAHLFLGTPCRSLVGPVASVRNAIITPDESHEHLMIVSVAVIINKT